MRSMPPTTAHPAVYRGRQVSLGPQSLQDVKAEPYVDAELRGEEREGEEEDGGPSAGCCLLLLNDLHELVRPPKEAKLLVRVDAGRTARDDEADDARKNEAGRDDKDLAENLVALAASVAREV